MTNSILNRKTTQRLLALPLLAMTLLASGCAFTRTRSLASAGSTSVVKSEIGVRSGSPTYESQPVDTCGLATSSLSFQTPLSIDDAIEMALANNDGFQATLAQMGMAEGDYLQSTLLTNPQFATMIPVGVKQWEWTLFVPIEASCYAPNAWIWR